MKVLVAVEDKIDAVAIVEAIRNRSWPSSTQFVLVHVVDVGDRFGEEALMEENCDDLDVATSGAYHMLLEASKQIKAFSPDSTTEIAVCCGKPRDEILEAMRVTHPNVVVVGKHARNRLLQLFHEDVGEQIVRAIPPEVDAVHTVEVPPLKRMTV